MAKRKPRREWTLDEIQEVRRLRDEEKLTFPQIGRRMGISGDKCRDQYHTGRTADKAGKVTGTSVCNVLGISWHTYRMVRSALQDAGKPSRPENVLAAMQEERR